MGRLWRRRGSIDYAPFSGHKLYAPKGIGLLYVREGAPFTPLMAGGGQEDYSRMKAMKPRAAFAVDNSLTGEGELKVELTFENMEDFSPAAVARKVGALNKLLEARTQLSNLVTYMDGKNGAEELLAKVLEDPALLQSLAATKKPEDGTTPPAA